MKEANTLACAPALHKHYRLEELGHDVGSRYIELVWLRERPERREVNVTKMLQFISGPVWRSLFDKPADGLQASTEQENQCRQKAAV